MENFAIPENPFPRKAVSLGCMNSVHPSLSSLSPGGVHRGLCLPRRFLSFLLLSALSLNLLSRAQGSLQLDFREGRPRLRWDNANGTTFQLLSSTDVTDRANAGVVTITSDAREVRWLDESADSSQRFYRWRISADAPSARPWQTTLNRIRTTAAVTGAAAAIITTNGLWVGTSGYAVRTPRAQTEPQMRFCMGSLSKSFVAATLLQLAEEGKLTLDDPVKKWLPDVPQVPNTITLRQTLDHTSGIYDYIASQPWEQRVLTRPADPLTLEELLGYVGEPYFAPGTAFHYSNTGYLLLGLIIEKVTRRSVMEEYRARFLEPLGLSSIYLANVDRPTGEVMHPYSYFNPSGTETDLSTIPQTAYFSCAWTAGALFASVEDIARWTHALWNGSLHSPGSYQEMTAWNPVGGAEKYGLAVWSQETGRGEFYVHSGHVPGYRCYAGYSPSLKATVVLCFNSDHFIQESWLQLVNEL